MTVKEVKELISIEPDYQEALADLFFDKRINNYILITKEDQKGLGSPVLLEQSRAGDSNMVVDVQFRIEFTISNIAKKSVMKPVVLLVFSLKNG